MKLASNTPSADHVTIVDIPEMRFLQVDGTGDSNTSQEYQEALAALYAVAYALKFLFKKELPLKELPLEEEKSRPPS